MTDTVTSETSTQQKIWANSGDSHFLEPDDIWFQILPKELAERMPRSEKHEDSETLYIDGTSFNRPMPRMGGITGEVRGEKVENMSLQDVSHRPPGARDVKARIKDLDGEGIWGEVVFPSLGLWDYLITDRKLAATAFRAMNEWKLSEVQGAAPDRLVVTPSIPLLNLEDAIAEIHHVASIGFHSVFLPLAPPGDLKDWNYDIWDPLWSAIEETGLVMALHLGTEGGAQGGMRTYGGPGRAVLNYVETTYGVQRFATKMVSSGVLERHPKLRILLSEAGASWIPFAGDRMNEGYRQHSLFAKPKLARLPKEYLYEHFYCSFQHDISAVEAAQNGYTNALWGSDYPHLEGTFGHTQDTLHELFDDITPELRQRITIGAFNELFPHVSPPPSA